MSLIRGCICSGYQSSQRLAIISDNNFTALCCRSDQVGEMIFGFINVDFVNQAADILGR